jgi:type IV pilus assembly protein PilA
MKQSVQKGFTLIELMIVVAIIGILAALAIPAYTDYTIKSRVGEGASLSGAFKTATEVYWSENGTLNGIVAGLNASTLGLTAVNAEYVSSILFVLNGTQPTLEVRLHTQTNKLGSTPANGGADGGCFTYLPDTSNGSGSNIKWSVGTGACAAAVVPPKYLPKT